MERSINGRKRKGKGRGRSRRIFIGEMNEMAHAISVPLLT